MTLVFFRRASPSPSPEAPFLFLNACVPCRSLSVCFAWQISSSAPHFRIVYNLKHSRRVNPFRRSSERRLVIWLKSKSRKMTKPSIEVLLDTITYGCPVPEQPARSVTTLSIVCPWALCIVIANPGSTGTCFLLIMQLLCDALCSKFRSATSGRIGKRCGSKCGISTGLDPGTSTMHDFR